MDVWVLSLVLTDILLIVFLLLGIVWLSFAITSEYKKIKLTNQLREQAKEFKHLMSLKFKTSQKENKSCL